MGHMAVSGALLIVMSGTCSRHLVGGGLGSCRDCPFI
jgi:hypothetical protein